MNPKNQKPISAYEKAEGMAYFPRMLNKIRLHAAGELAAEYHSNLGKGADARCLSFLRVDYQALCQRVIEGGSDSEIWHWCASTGRPLNADDLLVWNGFILKLGWKDFASGRLQQVKSENGLADRADIETLPDFFEVDEGRRP